MTFVAWNTFKIKAIDQRQSQSKIEHDVDIDGIEQKIDSLQKKSSTEAVIDNMRAYIAKLERNLTLSLDTIYNSMEQLKERNEPSFDAIESHKHQIEFLNRTLIHIRELNEVQDDDIILQLNKLREGEKHLQLALQENSNGDVQIQTSLQHQTHEVDVLRQTTVHMFDQCIVDDDTCTVGSGGKSRYWKACSTRFLPITKQVSLT